MLHKDSEKLKSLTEAFRTAEERVQTVILKTKAKDVEDYQLKVEKKLNQINVELTKKSIAWANSDMPRAYKDGKNNVDKSKPSSVKIDRTDIENAYIQLARDVQHATDIEKENIRSAIERAEKENKHGATVGAVKDIIQEELSKENSSMIIKYNNGAKMPLSAHAEMLARTSRIIASNTGSFDRCKELGIDLVRCTTVSGCCPYCKKYEGKVYSISGRDTRFPALYETALQSGYNIMHPNCRHEFIPFVEEMENSKNLKKIIEESNHFEDFNKNDKLFKIYNRNQAKHRQLVKESRLFHQIKNKLGEDAPYQNIGSFRRAYRSSEKTRLGYARTHYYARDKNQYERWKEVIPEDLPENIDEFQKIKYTKIDKFIELSKFRVYKKENQNSRLEDYRCIQELSKTELQGIPKVPPIKLDILEFSYNEFHINQERMHNISRKEAESYCEKSLFSMTQWQGRRIVYYSEEGAVCVDIRDKKIVTAFSSKQYDETVRVAMEVYKKWKK